MFCLSKLISRTVDWRTEEMFGWISFKLNLMLPFVEHSIFFFHSILSLNSFYLCYLFSCHKSANVRACVKILLFYSLAYRNLHVNLFFSICCCCCCWFFFRWSCFFHCCCWLGAAWCCSVFVYVLISFRAPGILLARMKPRRM